MLRDTQAAAAGRHLRLAQARAHTAEARAKKELWRYVATMVSGCDADPAAFKEKLHELQEAVAAYTALLDEAAAARARLPEDAARVAEAAKAAELTIPVDLTRTYKQYDDFRKDAATLAPAVTALQERRAAAYARCVENKARQ